MVFSAIPTNSKPQAEPSFPERNIWVPIIANERVVVVAAMYANPIKNSKGTSSVSDKIVARNSPADASIKNTEKNE